MTYVADKGWFIEVGGDCYVVPMRVVSRWGLRRHRIGDFREDEMAVIRECRVCGQKNRVPAKYLAAAGKCGSCKSALPAVAEPLAVDEALLDEIVRNAKVPVLIDFWADWCRPCKMAAPEVSKTAADMTGKAIVLKVDTEANQGLAGRFQIRGIPNFVVMVGGKIVKQQAGLVGHEVMEEWLERTAVGA
ncbi:MAG TPA: thioredoxin domain-containing protein [Candidatus Acidoferrum sp.]|jgi:thioredoxin 2